MYGSVYSNKSCSSKGGGGSYPKDRNAEGLSWGPTMTWTRDPAWRIVNIIAAAPHLLWISPLWLPVFLFTLNFPLVIQLQLMSQVVFLLLLSTLEFNSWNFSVLKCVKMTRPGLSLIERKSALMLKNKKGPRVNLHTEEGQDVHPQM